MDVWFKFESKCQLHSPVLSKAQMYALCVFSWCPVHSFIHSLTSFCPLLQKEPFQHHYSALILCLVLGELLSLIIVVRIKGDQIHNERTCDKQSICKYTMVFSFPVEKKGKAILLQLVTVCLLRMKPPSFEERKIIKVTWSMASDFCSTAAVTQQKRQLVFGCSVQRHILAFPSPALKEKQSWKGWKPRPTECGQVWMSLNWCKCWFTG